MFNLMRSLNALPTGVGDAQVAHRWEGKYQGIPRDVLILFIAFLVMCAVFAILKPQFLSLRNLINVFRQIAVVFILATGQTFVILSAGIDLSQGSIVSLVSVITADFLIRYGVLWGVVAGLGIGTICGLVSGLFVAKAKVQPFIVTLGMIFVTGGGALVYTGGAPILIFDKPMFQPFFWLGGGYVGPVPVPVIVAVLALILTYFVMYRIKFGRHVYAIGGNEDVAIVSGVKVAKTKILVFTLSAFTATVGGLILTSRVLSGQPYLGGFSLLMDSIASVVIGGNSLMGGEGGIFRTALGALIIGFMSNGLNLLNVSTFVQQIVIGMIIIVSVWVSVMRSRKA